MMFGRLAPLTLANTRKSEHHFQVQIKILNVNFSDAYRAWNLINTVNIHPSGQYMNQDKYSDANTKSLRRRILIRTRNPCSAEVRLELFLFPKSKIGDRSAFWTYLNALDPGGIFLKPPQLREFLNQLSLGRKK